MYHTAKLYSWLVLHVFSRLFFQQKDGDRSHSPKLLEIMNENSSSQVNPCPAGLSALIDTFYQVCQCSNQTFKEVLMLNFWQFHDSSLKCPYSIFDIVYLTFKLQPYFVSRAVFLYYYHYHILRSQEN